MFEAIKTSNEFNYSIRLSDTLSYLCIHEDYEVSFPAKLLFSMSPKAIKDSKLLELTVPEARTLIHGLNLCVSKRNAVSQFKGPSGGPSVFLDLDQLCLFLIQLFRMNSKNCIHFIEADPLEFLLEMFLFDDTKDKAVTMVLECINNSGQYKPEVFASLSQFIEVANIDQSVRGKLMHAESMVLAKAT